MAEVFSGSGCGPCVAADLAFEALLRRDPANEVAVLFYHEHTPVPDPLANPASIARSKYYGVRSVPMVYLDGDALPSIGGIRQMVQGSYTSLVSDVDRRLEIPADLD
ncbi:MAG TPA: hypothetical protein VET48_13700, partial [Steroidobacteraceae bacterium]|nr:hypothetical protein [Steroidobacteraceae bacterium]